MIRAKDIMTREVVAVAPDTDIAEAAEMLLKRHINGVPVVDGTGRLVGILCQSDLIAQQKRIRLPSVFTLLDGFIPLSSTKSLDAEVQKIAATTVEAAMTRKPVTVTPEASIEEVATLMVEKGFHTVPVVQGGRIVGVIGKEDVLRTVAGRSVEGTLR
ncbi:MAG: CBS domain-containing protein [Desulfobacterales bacterium]